MGNSCKTAVAWRYPSLMTQLAPASTCSNTRYGVSSYRCGDSSLLPPLEVPLLFIL